MATLKLKPLEKDDSIPFSFEDLTAAGAMGLSRDEALQKSRENSIESFLVSENDKPLAAFGYGAHGIVGHSAYPWLILTPDISGYRTLLARSSRRFMTYLDERYPRQETRVYKPHRVSLNWLRWLGFYTIGEDGQFHILERLR